MGERVETGGLMSFDYSNEGQKKLSEQKRREIENEYEKYYERKRREIEKKFFIILLITILILTGILAWIL